MIEGLRGVQATLRSRPTLRVTLQVGVSVALLAALLTFSQSAHLLDSLRLIDPRTFGWACALMLLGYVLNSCRWHLLLTNLGIRERLPYLASLYLIGQFFSLFLPTSAGGDAVRMMDVARRSGQITSSVIATLQERLIGLGAALILGLGATFIYLPLLPEALRIWVLLIEVVGVLGVAALLYPAWFFALARQLWNAFSKYPTLARAAERPLVRRVVAALGPIAALPPIQPLRLLAVMTVTMAAVLLGIAAYAVIGLALQIQISFVALCLVVPLVWIIRMVPISLGGLGVSEGSFVFLMSLFAVPTSRSLALALVMLAVQTTPALLGGLLLLWRMLRGTWRGVPPAEGEVA